MAIFPDPQIKFYVFNTSEIADPSGSRHIAGGSFAFEKEISEGFSNAVNFPIEINYADQPFPEYFSSDVKAIIFRTSGPTPPHISNMRFYMPFNDLSLSGVSIYQYAISGIWQPNPVWTSGLHPEVPTAIPESQNLFRGDGHINLLGANDLNVSQYIYMNVVVASGHPLGEHGAGINNRETKFRVVYDFFALNSGVF